MSVENQTETLKAMLDSVDAEIGQTEERLSKLKQRRETVRAWLAEEQPSQASLPIENGTNGSTPLSGFLRSVLADGKPRTAQELGALASAKGLVEGDKSPGRVAHFALVGLSQHDYVKRNNEGTWVAKKRALNFRERPS